MTILFAFLLMTIACVVIWRACDDFEAASEYLGRNLSDGVRGATLNAIGSSIPELMTTFFFLIYYSVILNDPTRASDGFAGGIGTTAGSAVFNAVIIPAVIILAVTIFKKGTKVAITKKVVLRDGIALFLASALLIFVLSDSTLQWWHGLILMLLYLVYIFTLFFTMDKSEFGAISGAEEFEAEQTNFFKALFTLDFKHLIFKNGRNTGKSWLLLSIATIIIGAATMLLVHSCEMLGHALNVNVYFIAVILASAATSLPDTVLSVKDAQKGNYDDALSNAIGSNIFDVCFALGFPLFVFTLMYGPITMQVETVDNMNELRMILLLIVIPIVAIFYFGKYMTRSKAFLLLSIYVAFTAYIILRASGNEVAEGIGLTLQHWAELMIFWK